MAKLNSLFPFTGSLKGLTVYQLPGMEAPVIHAAAGSSKQDIQTKSQYNILRRNNKEFGGRPRAASWILNALQPIRSLADYDTAGRLNRLLVPMQHGGHQKRNYQSLDHLQPCTKATYIQSILMATHPDKNSDEEFAPCTVHLKNEYH